MSFFSVGCADDAFVKGGFRNWRKATGKTGRFEKHVNSRMHQLSREKAIFRKSQIPVSVQLSEAEAVLTSKRQQERESNRHVVQIIFDVVRHLALQNEAFCGHDESSSSLYQGKFLEEIKFLAKYHQPLQKWLDNHPENVSWLGHDIQNEMLEIISTATMDTIKEQIMASEFYSVECDEVTSHKTAYMSIVIRYVDENAINERLVALKHVDNIKGKFLSDVLVEELKKMYIPLKNMVGKGFDGASNMSGKDNGMQQKLTEAGAILSLYFHCFAHKLNLVLAKASETLQPVQDVFNTIGAIYKELEGSPKREEVYKSYLKTYKIIEGRTALRSVSDTHWTAREDNLAATHNALQAIMVTVQELKGGDSACLGLLKRINSFQFVLKLVILKDVFMLTRYASEYLQREDMDMVTAVDAMQTLTTHLKEFRNEEKLAEFVEKAKEKAVSCGIHEEFDAQRKRKRSVPTRLADGQTVIDAAFSHSIPTQNQEENTVAIDVFRREFYFPFLDLLLSELQKRFSSEACEVMVQLSAFNPYKWNNDSRDKLTKYAQRYGISEESLHQEHSLFGNSGFFQSLLREMDERKKKGWKTPFLPLILKKFKDSDLENLYPSLHKALKIAACIPVTIASCERSHSKVKLINTYLRAKMREDRLEQLVVISSERDIASLVELTSLQETFAIKPRKVPL